ncbi:hypothetical protein [Herbiconiux ginsengi]|uniref:Gluconate 2-dehydrogenase subunit 3 n=1 Tax=Herbiconiux ginsengi TaxID=381665 RepID=A0A1H3THM7_9MICO|nr:hypothetical protein [Herbiconiux ginsengi]SDZ49311.1 hypothetical protein SAMN05216554_4207 [Herbiconiux ginsengi]
MQHDSVADELVSIGARVARIAFPHDVPDEVYRCAAADALAHAATDPLVGLRIRRALEQIREPDASDELLLTWLEGQTDEDWFRAFRQLVIPSIYGDPAVWARIGYEGPSHHLGGYLHRGFNDLTWLPEPRIAESTEPMIEIGPDHTLGDGEPW